MRFQLRHFAAAALLAQTAVLLPAVAGATVPAGLTEQGRLFDSSGNPLNTVVSLTFSIYSAPSGGTPLWTETQASVTLDQGYFSVAIGSVNAIPQSIWSGSSLYVGVAVNADAEMTPRQATSSVPYALVSNDAVGAIHPTTVSVNGQLVIDTNGDWVGPSSGLVGPTGPTGPAGAAGSTGATGAPGAAGATGAAGLAGSAGPQGPQGPIGATGAAGPPGAQGPQGPIGATGAQGTTGAIGPDGAQGPAGADGSPGPEGPEGATGATGANGVTGALGATGPTGAAGALGPAGPTGPQGATGAAGATGAQGVAGAAGSTGAAGPQGPAGANGAQGAAGTNGSQGPTGATGGQGIQGPTGATGLQGPAGGAGAQGATGATGPQGPAGPAGSSGGQANAGTASPVACANATEGMLWYDSSVPGLKVCNGSAYVLVNAVTAPPGPPATPTVTAGSQFLGVSWGAVSGATSYVVGYEAGTMLDANATFLSVLAGTQATINNLTNGVTYTVAVETVDGSFTSAFSNPVEGVPVPPSPPAAPTVNIGNASLAVSWSAVPNATSYVVGYEAGTVLDANATLLPVPTGTSTTINGLTNGVSYVVGVETVEGATTSAFSTLVAGVPEAAGYLACPTATLHPNNSTQDVLNIPVGTWACFVSNDGWVYALLLADQIPRTTGTTGLINGTSRSYLSQVFTRNPSGVWRQTTDADDPPTRPGSGNQFYTDGSWYGNGAYWLFSDAECTEFISALTYSYQIWSGNNCSDGTTTIFWANGAKHYINQLRY